MEVRASSFEVYDEVLFFVGTDLQIRPGTEKEVSSAEKRNEERRMKNEAFE